MSTGICLRLASLLATSFVAGCATTVPRDMPLNVSDLSVAEPSRPYVILGVFTGQMNTLRRGNALETYLGIESVPIPTGTQAIVPVITQWSLGYGHFTPDLSLPPPRTWSGQDHHLGIAHIGIRVSAINSAAGTATIQVTARLTDRNLDDEWWGRIDYQLIFLGQAPAVG
jgi:hypothetical protein